MIGILPEQSETGMRVLNTAIAEAGGLIRPIFG